MKPRVVRPVQALLVVGLLSAGLHAQNVGIGTTTPLTRLHVAAGDIFLGDATGTNGFVLHSRHGGGYDYLQITSRTAGSYEWGKGITFVRSTGNVGIGTTSPGTKLDVYGGSGTYIRVAGAMPAGDGNQGLIGYHLANTSTGGYWVMYLADPDGGFGVAPNSFEIWEYPANSGAGTCCRARLRILSSNGLATPTEVVINSAGNVGIGTAAPSERLDVQGNVRFSGALMPGGNAGTSGQVLVSQGAGTAPVWQPLSSLVTNAWLLTGNAGTNPATNFLGTTDAQPLVIRVGNQETFRFNPPGGSAPAWSIQRWGGNQRGLHAVDLQSARAQATQVASGNYSVIGGGQSNTASGAYATVGGGWGNTASGDYATVVGGAGNPARGAYATVVGGQNNTASGAYATVVGGLGNTASGAYATVVGGRDNTASGANATVGGGWQNTAGADQAIVGGGLQNTASGGHSVVPGGRSNTANANYNLVFGEDVDPSVSETYRVYFFGDGGGRPSGFLVINRRDGDFPIHVGINNTNGNGAFLTGAGQWANASSRSFKERFVQYRPAEVLEKILQLPVEGYFYKGTQEYHITPMAEDFYRLFGTGVHEIIETDSTGQLVRRPNPDVDKYLAASDVAGGALLGVQALHEENAQLRQRVSDLEREDAQLRQRVSDLKTENVRLRQQTSDIRTENAALRARLEQLEALVQKIASTQTNP